MDLEKLKFAINKDGIVTKDEENMLLLCYQELFKEIYGYDILTKYLQDKEKRKKGLLYQDAFVSSIDVLKSVKENKNLSLVIIYDENNNVVGFARIKEIDYKVSNNPFIAPFEALVDKYLPKEKCLSIPDIAISKKFINQKNEIWQKTVNLIEQFAISKGFDRLYVEIPLNSTLLLKADDLGFIESPEDIPTSEKPKTMILNKYLERQKNAEFNSRNK